ncbi:MAG: nucleotidyltransferase family protein [Pseudomonadota bacterium]
MRHAPDALMIFAAGFGTRMRAMTANRPKPLIPVAGKPLIDHALAFAEEAAIPRVVVNAHYLSSQITQYLSDRDVTVIEEQPDLLDTGGGLKNAASLLSADPVFTLNSDAVWAGPNPLDTLAAAWDPEVMDALLLQIPISRAHGRQTGGDFDMDGEGRLTRSGDYVYSGAQIIKTDLVAQIPDTVFSLNRVWTDIAAEQRLFGTVYPGHWCDVGHPDGIAEAERMLARV